MSKTFILLGRTGDLINALPLFFAVAQEDCEPPTVVVHKEYASVLAGCSYVNVAQVEGESLDLKTLPEDAQCIQVIADTETIKRLVYLPAGLDKHVTDSFAKEMYRLVDRMDLLKSQPRPVFDKRKKKREAALVKKVPDPEKTILVAAGGTTSPFPYKDLLFELLRGRFKDRYEIFDLSQIKADYIFDFLGLFSKAKCLVACDSALLHLAHAVPTLPVVALIQDRPSLWHGSPWRANHICHIRYGDFSKRAVEMLDAIERIGTPGTVGFWNSGGPRVIHVWSGYELNDETRPRHNEARATWIREYKSGYYLETQIEPGSIGRDSKYGSDVKDTQRYPFLKDVLRLACYRSTSNDDILCLTRSHTCFDTDFTERLLKSKLPVWSHRTLRNGSGDTFHPSCDVFAFTVGWWKQHASECPFLILSPDQFWNRILFDLCKRHGGSELPRGCFVAPYAAPKHKASPREGYNLNQLAKYEETYGTITLFPKVSDQLPTTVINRHALHGFGYNPAIVRWQDRWLMAYRHHNEGDFSTALAIAELDDEFNVKASKPLQIPHQGGSEEDAKFFIHKGQLHLSYVDSTYPAMPPKAVVKYGRLVEDTAWSLQEIVQPDFPGNDGAGCQKNYVFFEYGDMLWCLYRATPHTIISSNGTHTEPGLTWAYGEPRGGTPPIPYRDKLLRFFHSGLDNEAPPYRRRYYVGAMLLEPDPPFKPIAISKEPILRGSESDDLSAQERSSCIHIKQKVVFPCGAIPYADGWIVSVGINDAECALVGVAEGDLKL